MYKLARLNVYDIYPLQNFQFIHAYHYVVLPDVLSNYFSDNSLIHSHYTRSSSKLFWKMARKNCARSFKTFNTLSNKNFMLTIYYAYQCFELYVICCFTRDFLFHVIRCYFEILYSYEALDFCYFSWQNLDQHFLKVFFKVKLKYKKEQWRQIWPNF